MAARKSPDTNLALNAVIEVLHERQGERALGLLLDLWRSTHEPRVAEAIERLSPKLRGATRPDAMTAAAKNARQAWLALEKNKTDATLPWLLDEAEHPQDSVVEERIKTMAAWAPDPRVSTWALGYLAMLAEANVKASRRNSPHLCSLLAAMRDPRVITRLAAFEGSRSSLGQRIGINVREALSSLRKQAPVSLPSSTLATLDAAIESLAAPSSDQSGLRAAWEAVWAAPDDDAARLVLSDALLEAGHPLGAFIALQLKRHQAKEATPSRKEADLLKRHLREWRAPYLPEYRSDYGLDELNGLRRGLLEEAKLQPTPGHEPGEAWRSVQHVIIEDDFDGFDQVPATYLTSKVFSNVRKVWLPLRWVCASVEVGRPLSWRSVNAQRGSAAELRSLAKALNLMPHLRTLLVRLDEA